METHFRLATPRGAPRSGPSANARLERGDDCEKACEEDLLADGGLVQQSTEARGNALARSVTNPVRNTLNARPHEEHTCRLLQGHNREEETRLLVSTTQNRKPTLCEHRKNEEAMAV